MQEFRSGDILEPYPEEEIGRQWKKFSKRNRTIHPVFRYWYRYVALIVLLLGAAGVLKWQLDETRKTSERTTQTISLAQGSPLLVLADGRTMLLNDSGVGAGKLICNRSGSMSRALLISNRIVWKRRSIQYPDYP